MSELTRSIGCRQLPEKLPGVVEVDGRMNRQRFHSPRSWRQIVAALVVQGTCQIAVVVSVDDVVRVRAVDSIRRRLVAILQPRFWFDGSRSQKSLDGKIYRFHRSRFSQTIPKLFSGKKHSFLSRQNCSGVNGPFDESEFVEVLKTFPLLPLWIQQQVSLLLGCCWCCRWLGDGQVWPAAVDQSATRYGTAESQ